LLGLVPLQFNGHRKLLGIVPVHGLNRWIPALQGGNGSSSTLDFFMHAEYYRTIRTNILLSSSSEPVLSLLITSPVENEAKTSVAVNLAVSMAQLEGLQVVLINGDLRGPNQQTFFGPPKKDAMGLAHYLTGQANFEDIVYPTEIPNLSVVPHGLNPSNPSELLHSKRMADVLKRLTGDGFQVILDAPPVLPVADSVILSAQSEGVILVISEGETTRETCHMAINQITSCGGKLIGTILQKTEPYRVLSHPVLSN
jgi:succinoglycan biosynthesis transport protein ExoP